MSKSKSEVVPSLVLSEALMNHINTSQRLKGSPQDSADRYTIGYLVSMIADFIEAEPAIADMVENRIKAIQLRILEDNFKGFHNVQ